MKRLFKQPQVRSTTGRCQHSERLTTVNFGLERSVCITCGDVAVRDRGHTGSGDLFTPDPNRAEITVG